jgi:hypothetical protein
MKTLRSILLATSLLGGGGSVHAQDATMMQMDIWDLQDSLDDIQDTLANREAPAPAPSYAAPALAPSYAAPAPTYQAPAPGQVSSVPYFRAYCTYNNKSIKIDIDANDNTASASAGLTTMLGHHRQAMDGATGTGHYVYENDTPTVWYVAPANSPKYRSAVKLQGKWRPMQCGGFVAAN